MRIGIDGFNLAMPHGTGVATYGASLATVLGQRGHQVEGLFGIDAGRRPDMREVLFFEWFGQGHRISPAALAWRAGRSVVLDHMARRPVRVPLTDAVEKRAFGYRLPNFAALWTVPLLFETAWARFRYFGRFVEVSMPDPPAIMHWTYPLPVRVRGVPNIYTIHDLVPLKLPHTTLDDKAYYRRLVSRCIRTSAHIATVSEASRADILDLFDVSPDKVTNTYQSSPIPAEIRQSTPEADADLIKNMFDLNNKDFYLFYGALDPKKNIGRIVDAYLTSQSRRPLVVVSSRDWGMESEARILGKSGEIYGRNIGDRVIQLQYLPRPTLFRLARSARAVLFPSLYEGFGLPALEAVQLGTPVISSNVSSLPEVVGEAGLLVDPYRSDEIAAAIRRIDEDDALLARLGAAGIAQAAKFSDAAFGERLDAMYRKIIAS